MDDKRLADYLHELVRFRNCEQVQKEEFNTFTEEDSEYYQSRTDLIYKLACEYDRRSDESPEDDSVEDVADTIDELAELKNKYMYLAADFDNYKKRVTKNEQYTHDKVYEDVIFKFLSIYDDMERLYDSLDLVSDEPTTELSKEHAAYSMIFENIKKTLNNLGCEKIDCHKGDVFDVNFMEAISTRYTKPDEYLNSGEVAGIYQSGWKYKEKVIRPVKVIVAN